MKKLTQLNLQKNQVISLTRINYIHVTAGNVWLTANGNLRDFVLSAGDVLKNIDFKGVVVQAFGNSEIKYSNDLCHNSEHNEQMPTIACTVSCKN